MFQATRVSRLSNQAVTSLSFQATMRVQLDRPDPGLHGTLRVIPAADNRRAAIRCPACRALSEKGTPLSFNRRLKKFPGASPQ
jgi:hypothetical protein